MSDMTKTIVPKSDQLNADDLIAGRTLTIKVTSVSVVMGEQPVSIHYEGDGGKPYKPGKSMRRVLVNCWGADANKYIGRSMRLYRDEKVKFGGVDVGGIRISHLSDISSPITLALTATKAQRKPFTVQPIAISEDDKFIADMKGRMIEAAGEGTEELKKRWTALDPKYQEKLENFKADCWAIAKEADTKK